MSNRSDTLDTEALQNTLGGGEKPDPAEETDPGAGNSAGTAPTTEKQDTGNSKQDQGTKPKAFDHDDPPIGPWGNRGVTSRKAGTKKAPEASSSLNVRVNLDLRADVALELHAVIQGDITI
ncbi:hypothetical protein BJX66DRAFT_345476, partial [Aspergillus keveii]